MARSRGWWVRAQADLAHARNARNEIRRGQPLARQALAQGRILWRRPGFEPHFIAQPLGE